MSKNYINNLETGHIELHFEKEDYQALSAEEKRELKSAYLWSRYATAWVSRSTKNHWSALRVAEKLGFTAEEKQGERLSFAEEMERKAEKAERRADKFEYKADKAIQTAKGLQSELKSYHGDNTFFTQPNINSSGGRAFTRYREKIFDRYNKGFEEYRKSEYYLDRAETARKTADMKQLQNPVYIANRIKEQNSTIKKLQSNIVNYENKLYRIEQGEELKNYKGEILTAEQYQNWIDETLSKLEYEIDKLAYFENVLEEIGGNKFSKENIKVGYIVNIRRHGKSEVLSAGPKNIKYKILEGGAAGMVLTTPYAGITEILEAKEVKEETKNPYTVGDILCHHSHWDAKIINAFQVVKVTKTGVKIQKIKVEDGKPVKDEFISEKQEQKKVVKSKFSDFIGVYYDDWQLHKYTA